MGAVVRRRAATTSPLMDQPPTPNHESPWSRPHHPRARLAAPSDTCRREGAEVDPLELLVSEMGEVVDAKSQRVAGLGVAPVDVAQVPQEHALAPRQPAGPRCGVGRKDGQALGQLARRAWGRLSGGDLGPLACQVGLPRRVGVVEGGLGRQLAGRDARAGAFQTGGAAGRGRLCGACMRGWEF